MDQKSEGPPKKEPRLPFTVVEAPETLEPGQNFYDQKPFSTIMSEEAATSGTDVSKIRKLISSLVKLGIDVEGNDPSSDLTSLELFKKIRNPYDSQVKKVFQSHRMCYATYPQYFEVITFIFKRLEEFPYWHNYVWEQKTQASYKHDGSYIERPLKSQVAVFPESYAKYASDRIRRTSNAVLVGIEEIFPDYFKGESPFLSGPVPKGERPQRRKWAILKTAELT